MSEHLTPDERDELASAYLDGEADKDEILRVENDPALLLLVEELRELAEQVSAPTPGPSQTLRAMHIGAALAAFDAESAKESSAETKTFEDVTVTASTPLGDQSEADHTPGIKSDPREANTVLPFRRRAKQGSARRQGGMPAWLSVAAASLAVLGGVSFLLTQDRGGESDSAAESFSEAANPADGSHSVSGADSQMANAEMAEISSQDFAADSGTLTDEMAGDAMESSAADLQTGADEEAAMEEEDQTEEAAATTIIADADTDTKETDGPSAIPIEHFFPAGATAEEIAAEVDLNQVAIEDSVCATTFEAQATNAVVSNFAVINLDGRAAELLLLNDGRLVLLEVPSCLEVGP